MALAQPETPTSAGIKLAITLTLVVATQVCVFRHELGWAFGAFLLACAAAVAVTQRGLWRRPLAVLALAVAAVLALIEIDQISPIGLPLFWIALTCAALLANLDGFDDIFRLAQRTVMHGAVSLFGPLIDFFAGVTGLPRGAAGRFAARTPIVILPVVGGIVFLSLFAVANPVLGELMARIHWPVLDEEFFARILFAGIITVLVWGFLRPRLFKPFIDLADKPPVALSAATLVLSLAVFNAIFALQNGLDLAFLWSGAKLPAGVTFADYAHKGAYTLILTALLAGAFTVVALHPSTPASSSRWVRLLLILWTVQNLFLVASSALRLADYVEAYALTELRIAAFVWMAVVAAGLILICWRMLRGRSTAWLMNANAVVVWVALIGSAAVDYGAVAAHWNVRHPPAVDPVDVCYLERIGQAAYVPLIELERRSADPVRRETIASVRQRIAIRMMTAQDDPFSRDLRRARRLDRGAEVAGGALPPPGVERDCQGRPLGGRRAESYAPDSH